jgi:hypothetical protein
VISPALEAQQTTLRFHADPTIIDVTFDAANVRIEDVKKWMQLRDYISNENGYQVPVSLEECHKEDPRYVDCGIDRGSLNIHDARLNMDKIRKNFADLDPKRFPDDLSSVVLYLKQIQRFALWRDAQIVQFVETGKVSALESAFQTINPQVSCKTTLDQIRSETDKARAWELVWHDWDNCVLKAERKQIGPYPQKAWESFISAHGIREHVFQEEIN